VVEVVTPARYRRRPTVTEAIQFTGENAGEIVDTFGGAGIHSVGDYLVVTTTNQRRIAVLPGDWIIPDSRPDTFYPCAPEVFAAYYEPVVE
jgi:hypothetical protein